ncbi:MAG: hypothetical protein IC227_03345 [Enterococcus lacertideformus]|uniref:Uncharacterized protein n=1 Tax=Enterococcus lacertideformus TaxID=2771493 RepID=A0A931FAM4_9ENTE|nr:hypothetical protein [Enterococcus lacertideformus]
MSQKWEGHFSTPEVFIILICMVSNFIPLFYFKNYTDHLKNELKKKTLNSWLIIALLVVLVILAIGTIIFIPTFFKTKFIS